MHNTIQRVPWSNLFYYITDIEINVLTHNKNTKDTMVTNEICFPTLHMPHT